MLAELLQAMPKNDLANVIEDAPTTRKEPFWNDRESNLFLMLCPAVQRSLFCGSATQEDLADSEISDTQPRDVKVPIKQ